MAPAVENESTAVNDLNVVRGCSQIHGANIFS